MRRFVLMRHEDETGVSGTGVVAEGVEWTDGTVSMRWMGARCSTVYWDNVADAIAIHGHNGKTELKYVDQEDISPEFMHRLETTVRRVLNTP